MMRAEERNTQMRSSEEQSATHGVERVLLGGGARRDIVGRVVQPDEVSLQQTW